MPVEETLYELLSTDVPLLALSPTIAQRIKPPGNWQFMPRPYIIYRPITFDPTYCHNHETAALIDHYPNFQISVVADDYSMASAVANAVNKAIRGTTNGTHSGWQFFLRARIAVDFDTDRKIQEIAMDYQVFGR